MRMTLGTRPVLCSIFLVFFGSQLVQVAAAVPPMIKTEWGQSAPYNRQTPLLSGERTYPGCTTLALAQILNYYRYRDRGFNSVSYWLDNENLDPRYLELDLTQTVFPWDHMPDHLRGATQDEIDAVSTFSFQVGVALNVQFDLGNGSPATGKQLENAVRYAFGYNNKGRRQMHVALRATADGYKLYSDEEWRAMVIDELDQGRPVLHMARNQNGEGHAFVIDGYDDSGQVHVNWGWAGHANGYYDLFHLQPEGSESVWNLEAMIYVGLEPEDGFAAAMAGDTPDGDWIETSHAATVQAGEWRHFGPFHVGEGTFDVRMQGTGDADLHLRSEAAPTETEHDCRPYLEGSDEQCSVEGPGRIFVAVNGYADRSVVDLIVRYPRPTPAPGGDGPDPQPTIEGVDLILRDAALAFDEAVADTQVPVSVEVFNAGNLSAGPTRLKYYFSTDAVWDSGDTYRNYDAVSALAGSTGSEENANVRIPADTAPGSWYIVLVADANGDLAETDESNNWVALPIRVR